MYIKMQDNFAEQIVTIKKELIEERQEKKKEKETTKC